MGTNFLSEINDQLNQSKNSNEMPPSPKPRKRLLHTENLHKNGNRDLINQEETDLDQVIRDHKEREERAEQEDLNLNFENEAIQNSTEQTSLYNNSTGSRSQSLNLNHNQINQQNHINSNRSDYSFQQQSPICARESALAEKVVPLKISETDTINTCSKTCDTVSALSVGGE